MFRFVFAMVLAWFVMVAPTLLPSASAANDVWDGNLPNFSDNKWGSGSNWSDNTTPNIGDTATFNFGWLVIFDAAPVSIQALNIAGGDVTFASSGGARTLSVNSGGTQTTSVDSRLFLGTSGNPLHLNSTTLNVNGPGPAQLGVNFGSDVHVTALNVGTTAGGLVEVNGSGSELRWSGTANVGANGNAGELRFQNSASTSGTMTGPLKIANSAVVGTTGTVNVESGAVATFQTLDLAADNTDVGTATLNIQGSGSTVNMFSLARVGNANAGTAAVNIGTTASGAALFADEAGIQINETGTITIGSGSTSGLLNVEGPISINGGALHLNNAGLDYKQIFVSNGGSVTYSTDMYIDRYSINGDPQSVSVSDGSIEVAGRVLIGYDRERGSLSVSGPSSSIVANSPSPSLWGDSDNSQFSSLSAIFSNGASGSFSGGITINGADYHFGFSIQSGADVSVGNLSVQQSSGLSASAVITVSGAGSTLTLTPSSTLTLGHNFNVGTAQLDVLDNAVVTVGAGGTTILNATGTINLNGGTFNTPTFTENGTFNFTSGTLGITGPAGLTIGAGGPLGSLYSLGSNRTVSVPNSTTINAGSSFTLDGGTLNTGSLVVNGNFIFSGGTLGFVSAGGGWNAPIVVQEFDATIDINAANVSLGSAASFSGFHHSGSLNVAAGASVTLNSAGYARLGVVTSLAGGTIMAPNGIYLPGSANLFGNGAVNARVTGDGGSLIEADGALSVGDATSPAGFNFGGELRTRQHTVTLHSSSQASLGNLTTVGNGSSPGTLVAGNGIVVDFGEAIVGYGTITSTNSLAKRTVINGIAQGNSIAQPLTFDGYVKGVGTFDNVVFAGTFDPGLSPTLLTAGNLALASTGLLNMELGGLNRGSDYDAILASGQLSLSGTLNLSLINGFVPETGNTFDILDWSVLAGTFSSIELPTLTGGKTWNTSQLYTTGIISVEVPIIPGDFDSDGDVDGTDFVIWQDNFPMTSGAMLADGDADGDGDVDGADFIVWQTNFPFAPSPGTSPVPEPGGIALALMGFVALGILGARHYRECA